MIPGDTLPLNTNSDTINDRTDASDFTFEESESLSDIDDSEVFKFSELLIFCLWISISQYNASDWCFLFINLIISYSLTVEQKHWYWQVDVYINTEEEKNLKTTVWEEINREYLEVLWEVFKRFL